MTLDKALEEVPQLKQLNEQDERVKELLAVARRLEGMTRHASVHAAGVVIAPRAHHGVRARSTRARTTKSRPSGR